ncbi:hypothetical protein [Lacihabitans lacunae]|uniref:DUF6089 domain-containing protein n=1 Tax=Lacihabitans lacunae TaxID=1028214 RepID=A0ABV7YUC8_9BACT
MITSIKKPIIAISLFLIMIGYASFAQNGLFSRKKVINQYATVGLGGGTSHYFGDLAPYSYAYYGIYTNVRWNANINYTRFLTSNFAARVSLSYIRLAGDDNTFAKRNLNALSALYLRNLSFRNDLKEFTLTGLYNLLPTYSKGAKGRAQFMPYIGIGIGLYGHNPLARKPVDYNTGELIKGDWVALKPLNTSGQGLIGSTIKPYSLVQPVIPLVFGLRFKINQNFDFTAEAGFRYTPFDYIDDVGSTGYPSQTALINSPNGGKDAAKFSYRANELYAANTLANRLLDFKNAAIIANPGKAFGAIDPENNAGDAYDISRQRGNSIRFDSYIVTQFTISYVLSNNIKCPVIR